MSANAAADCDWVGAAPGWVYGATLGAIRLVATQLIGVLS